MVKYFKLLMFIIQIKCLQSKYWMSDRRYIEVKSGEYCIIKTKRRVF